MEWSRTSVVSSLVCFYCSTNIVSNKFIKKTVNSKFMGIKFWILYTGCLIIQVEYFKELFNGYKVSQNKY